MSKIEVLEWSGSILKIPDHQHLYVTEVYENITGILLGLVKFKCTHTGVVRIPLLATSHYGCKFEGEHSFKNIEDICHAKYIDLKAENFYFNRGQQCKIVLWADYHDWIEFLQDRDSQDA